MTATLPMQVSLTALGVATLLLGLGFFMVYGGFREYRVGRLIRDTATGTVQGAAVGRTELQGRVDPAGEPLARPFSDGDYVIARYQIREERENDEGESTWTTLDHDTWVMDFYLDDGTGRILVEPPIDGKIEISDANTNRITVPAGRRGPEAVEAFLAHGTDVGTSRRNRRRYVEEVIPPDETVYVLGEAAIRDAASERGPDQLVIRRDRGSGRFVVSDMPEAELTRTLSRRAPILIALGIAVSALGVYLGLDQLLA